MFNKKLTFLSFLIMSMISASAHATVYYFANSGNDTTNTGISSSSPWASLNQMQKLIRGQVSGKTVQAGDKILFKSGDTFLPPDQYGGLQWWNTYGYTAPSGTAASPITIGSYGTGAKPNFQFPYPATTAIDSRSVFHFLSVSYIVIDGLSFIDTRFPTTDKVNPAYTSAGIVIGEIGHTANNMTVQNCDLSNIGNGINVVGNYNTITHSNFTDFKAIINTSTPTTEDYGANGITSTGSNNTYTYNYMNGLWAASLDFGWNGGAFEMYEGGHNNVMMYNTIIDCGGFAEYGSSSSGNTAGDDTIAYNLVINVGDMLWVNGVGYGGFAEDVRNLQYFNNTVIENASSRFSGSNAGAGLPTTPTTYRTKVGGGESRMFGYGGTAPAVWAVLKNNIFILNTGVDVVGSNGASLVTHENNLYNLSNGSIPGVTLNTTSGKVEVSTSATVLADAIPSNTDGVSSSNLGGGGVRCLNLISTSPAIDIGASLGFTADLNGGSVPQGGKPDAGCAEYGSGTSTADTTAPVVSFTSPTANSTVSGTITLSATATDNSGTVTRVDFYNGTTFIASDTATPFSVNWDTKTVADGNYTLNAKAFDAANNMAMASVMVTVKNVTADTTAPVVSFTSPTNGSTITGTKQLAATATDNSGTVTKVEFYDGGTLLRTDTAAPFAFNLDTTTIMNGSHTFYAKAYDAANNMAMASVMVTVSNTVVVPDTTAPMVMFTAPDNNATISGLKELSVNATDNTGVVSRVDFYDDTTLIYTDMTEPFAFDWDTTTVADGNHVITAKAYDAADNMGTASITLTISNTVPNDPPVNDKPINGGSSQINGTSTVKSGMCQSNGASSLLLFMLPVLFIVARRRKFETN